MNKPKMSRRSFMEKCGTYAVAGALSAPALLDSTLSAQDKTNPQQTMDSIRLDISKPEYSELNHIGGAVKIPNPYNPKRPIIVCRISGVMVAAYSSRCTHFACEVPLPVNNVITCRCHKSQFDAMGKLLKGPAQKSLASFPAVLDGSIITIKMEEIGLASRNTKR